MLTFPIIWDISFSSFEMFIAVGIVWMLWIEKLFPSRSVSTPVMIFVALAAAGINWYLGYHKVRKAWQKAQNQIRASEDAEVEYEGEIA